jgi:cell division protein FtsQ
VKQPRPPARRDPAPSRQRYKLTRLWLRPGVRRATHLGVPAIVGVLAAWTLMAEYDVRGRALALVGAAREAIIERPQFVITAMEIPGVSRDLAEQIRVAAFVRLPVSSLELDVGAVRERIEALSAVERARVRALASGVLLIEAVERVPVVVWRAPDGIELLDRNGVRVAEVDSRLRRPDLPLIAGVGADRHVPEALAVLAQARPIGPRVRGLVRMSERRWNLVLDRDQVVKLPEEDPTGELGRVMALDKADELFRRDLTVVDLRDPRRPMLRLTETARQELERLKKSKNRGEDA